MTDDDRLDHDFDHHPPTADRAERHAALRLEVKTAARYVLEHCPPGRERSLALTKLEEALFWANASIARSE